MWKNFQKIKIDGFLILNFKDSKLMGPSSRPLFICNILPKNKIKFQKCENEMFMKVSMAEMWEVKTTKIDIFLHLIFNL